MAKINFTKDRLDEHKCPPDKPQAFVWDSTTPGLGLRVTPAGKPSFIFQGLFQGKTIRVTIGGRDAWSIPLAREKARELQRQLDEGDDPREVKAAKMAADTVKRETEERQGVMARKLWDEYLAERKPQWGDRHYEDHINLSYDGTVIGVKGKPLKKGILAPLLALPMRDLTAPAIEEWAKSTDAQKSQTRARLAWRLLKAFLNWCAEHKKYSDLVPARNPAKRTNTREALGTPGVKVDQLQRGQLRDWFATVRKLHNPTAAAYLQVTLLTGARSGETLGLEWTDIDFKWKTMRTRDKDVGERTIPLTPYVESLITALPRKNKYVFAGPRTEQISNALEVCYRVCDEIEVSRVSIHGLRRTFKSLTEWMEIPAGVVAQLMGHKPSAIAEKHYTFRPIELLALFHVKIEAWILEQAGIPMDPSTTKPTLHLVAA